MPASGPTRAFAPRRPSPSRAASSRPSPSGAVDSWRSRRRLRALAAALLVLLAATLFVREKLTTTTVLVASSDLTAGHALGPDVVREIEVPGSVVSDSALTSTATIEGRELVSAIGEGEILTESRVDAPATTGSEELRTVSVPVPDRGTLALLHPGASVDIFAATSAPAEGPNHTLATGVKVTEVPRDSRGEPAGTVAIQVPTADAPTVASAAMESPLIIVLAE